MVADNNVSTGTPVYKDDDEFREIATERFMYNADKCKETPLVGYLLNLLPMPPLKTGKDPKTGEPVMRDWAAFLIRTTRPVLAINRDKQVAEVPPGSEVLIPATYELQQFVTKAATAPEVCYEVRIAPSKKIPLDHGQTMWLYKLAAKPVPNPRRAFGLTAVLAPHQLTAASASSQPNEADVTSAAGSDDIPF
jgi:hypothetical protein